MSFLDRDANRNASGETAFKRVTGASKVIADGATENIDLIFPYAKGAIKGAIIVNTHIGDSLNFKICDNGANSYSGVDVEIAGPNVTLNQFGFDVYPPDGSIEDTAEFSGTLYVGMVIRCEYTNNSGEEKTVYMNSDIYELIKE